ncbi:MAG: hypothetical protein F6J92_13220 [Symploca sp. SIO1A3]|nr:hypothetical protein [Symploca sp. SIO1A3]
MADFVLIDGDQVIFNPAFTPATVVVQPGKITGSAQQTYQGKKICVAGDENSVSVPGCTYMTPVYSIPGTGTLKIEDLGADQKAKEAKCSGKPVLLKGSVFTATFQVQQPAQMPPPGPGSPTPDPMPQYPGTGNFITTNMIFQAA